MNGIEIINAAKDVVADAQAKVAAAQSFIEIANKQRAELILLRDQVAKESADLDRKRKEIEVMNKRLRYVQLRIQKIIDERNLDQEIKKMLAEAMEGKSA